METSKHQILLSTCPKLEVAQEIADQLVEEKLAACVNILPQVHSTYRWQGKIEHDDECLMIVKFTAGNYQQIEQCIKSKHPYELPEIIAVPIVQGLEDYLSWLDNPESE